MAPSPKVGWLWRSPDSAELLDPICLFFSPSILKSLWKKNMSAPRGLPVGTLPSNPFPADRAAAPNTVFQVEKGKGAFEHILSSVSPSTGSLKAAPSRLLHLCSRRNRRGSTGRENLHLGSAQLWWEPAAVPGRGGISTSLQSPAAPRRFCRCAC